MNLRPPTRALRFRSLISGFLTSRCQFSHACCRRRLIVRTDGFGPLRATMEGGMSDTVNQASPTISLSITRDIKRFTISPLVIQR